jgi:hypothetical protein
LCLSERRNLSDESSQKTPARRKPRLSLRKRVLLAVCGCLFGWLLAEGMLILAGVSFPLPYQPDPHCGTRLRPGFRGFWSKEGGATFEVNSAGFRDREHALEKPVGVIRVAVLGDSYIEALQVPSEAMFATVLEQELNSRKVFGEKRVEVLSFGVSGFGTAQELLMLRHHVWQCDPDHVLLAFLPGNDIRNNSRELEPQKLRPFFDVVDDGVEPDFSFRSDPLFQYSLTRSFEFKTGIINASRVVQLARAIRDGEVSRPRTPAGDGDTHQGEPSLSRDQIGLDDQCFIEPDTAAWQSAWSLTERLIEQMNSECRQRQCGFSMAIVTSGLQVNPDDELRRQYAARLGVIDLDYADRRLARLGERLGCPVIPLSAGLPVCWNTRRRTMSASTASPTLSWEKGTGMSMGTDRPRLFVRRRCRNVWRLTKASNEMDFPISCRVRGTQRNAPTESFVTSGAFRCAPHTLQ